jgi:hypothetical protein
MALSRAALVAGLSFKQQALTMSEARGHIERSAHLV